MNIGFDAKRAYFNYSGLGNYSRTLVKSLIQYFPENNYSLFTPRKTTTEFSDFIARQRNVAVVEPTKFLTKNFSSYWRSFLIPKEFEKNNLNIFHGLSNELPLNTGQSGVKTVVTIHDLIFIRYPEFYAALDRKIYSIKFKSACEESDIIIAVSEQTKRDIVEFFRVEEKKIKVVYQSCNPIFYNSYSNEELLSVKKKHNLPNEYLLYVGTIESRKNLLTIIKAMTLLKTANNVPLVVVGKKQKDYFRQIENYISENKLEQKIIFLEQVSTDDLPCIYRQSQLFIYPSIFEGFGIPIIEALISKVPVITSNGSCFPEAGGPNSSYISAMDAQGLANEIDKILNSSELRNTMISKGFEYADRFHPKKFAENTMEVYKSLM